MPVSHDNASYLCNEPLEPNPNNTSHTEEPSASEIRDAELAIERFIDTHPRPTVTALSSSPRLPFPIVIPQRRPGNKARGFVDAYAPVLEQFDISQEAFIDLIKAVNKAMKVSKWLVAVQLAAAGTGFVPNSIAMGTAAGVQLIAGVIAKAERRWKTNSFLDHINHEVFRPRGLYCLLISYNPIARGEKLDDEDAIAKSTPSSPPTLYAKVKRNLRNPVAGTAEGEDNLPSAVAPLIYHESLPGDHSQGEDEKERTAFSRLNNYFDRRAQARYACESKRDVLSIPSQAPFRNRYLDPNHPATNGGLAGLLSGGRLTEKYKESMKAALASQETALREQQSSVMGNLQQQLQYMNVPLEQQQAYMQQCQDNYNLQLQQLKQQVDLTEQGQRRIVRDILYLMIVNMPSTEAMETARERLDGTDQVLPTDEVTMTTVE